MSVDIQYIAFDAKKADKKWKSFSADLQNPAGKQNLEDTKALLVASEEFERAREEAMRPYEEKLSASRKKIFKFLAGSGYVIPGTDWVSEADPDGEGEYSWMTAKDKFDYVINFGVLQPKDATPEQIAECKKKPIMLRTLNYDLELEYYQLLEERDAQSEAVEEDNPWTKRRLEKNDPFANTEVDTASEQEPFGGDDYFDFEYIYSDEPVKKESLLHELMKIDLFYGGVFADHLEHPKIEETQYNALTENGPLHTAGERNIEKEIRKYAEERRVDIDEAKEEIDGYLEEIAVVTDELCKNESAVLVRLVNYEGAEDEEVDSLLQSRAEQHLNEYADILPPLI